MGGGGSTKYRYIKYCVFIKYVYSDSCRNSLKLNFFSIFFKVTLSPTFFFFLPSSILCQGSYVSPMMMMMMKRFDRPGCLCVIARNLLDVPFSPFFLSGCA